MSDKKLSKGDKVEWNSHGGTAEGTVEKKITSDTHAAKRDVKASKDEAQYLVKSDKSGGEAVHKPDTEEEVSGERSSPRARTGRSARMAWDLSTSTSQPGEDGSKPCSTSQRTAVRQRSDHHARITSRSTSRP